MDQNIGRTDLLPDTIPVLILLTAAVVALAGWYVLHAYLGKKLKRSIHVEGGATAEDPNAPQAKLPMSRQLFDLSLRWLPCVVVGTVAVWVTLQVVARGLFLSGAMSLWGFSLLTAMLIDGIALFYEHECEIVPKKFARWLVLMRLLAVGLTLFIVLQPVFVTDRSRTVRRRVAVLADASDSMYKPDLQWRLTEILDTAQGLGWLTPKFDGKSVFAAVEGEKEKDNLDLLLQRPLRDTLRSAAEVQKSLAVWRQLGTESLTSTNQPGGFADEQREALLEQLARARTFGTTLTNNVVPLIKVALTDKQRPHRESLERALQSFRDEVLPAIGRMEAAVKDKKDIKATLASTVDLLNRHASGNENESLFARVAIAGDTLLWDALSEDFRTHLRKQVEVPRDRLVREALFPTGRTGLYDALQASYYVDLFRFGRSADRVDPELLASGKLAPPTEDETAAGNALPETPQSTQEAAFRSVTDVTRSLEDVLAAVPSEELAGVLLLTDGRHTGEAGTEAVSRRLGQARVPVSTVVVGGTQPPFDISLAFARAPESVFLGDKVRVTAAVLATGAKGQETKLRLFRGEKQIAEEIVEIDSDDFVKEFRLTDLPEEQGVHHYKVTAEPLKEEKLTANNSWSLDVSVSDDRTNVLLVDNLPRWEYRYLRNLFYGRDKSVHLQFLLMRPDEIAGRHKEVVAAASASRPFGDAEAGALPVTREEWRKFDVIIIGDVAEDVLTPAVVENIRYCVEDRGALLVVIAGPDNMPFAIRNQNFRNLLPILYEPGDRNARKPPEEAYRFNITAAGRSHDVLRMSASVSENEQIWADMPDFHWRIPVTGIKPGAEVLASAVPVGRNEAAASREAATASPDEVIQRLSALREQEARNSLVVGQSQGRGKVLMLNFDRTWRFRYRAGDVYHHRFWGQVMRWGIGEKLRSGNTFVRLGTDQLSYTPVEPIRVIARMCDQSFAPIAGAKADAMLMSASGRNIKKIALTYRENSNGIYEGLLDPLTEAGTYTLKLNCPTAARTLGADFPSGLETQFIVLTARRPAEFIHLTADWRVPRVTAELSGGKAVSLADWELLRGSFGEGNRVLIERIERKLWDRWWYFVILVGFLTAEWLLRKKSGLA